MKKKKKRIHLNLALYCMLIPGFVYLLFNNYIPMTFTVIAFKKFNFQKGIWGSDFIGLDNFKSLFSTRDSWIILRNTVGYNLIFIAVSGQQGQPCQDQRERSPSLTSGFS